MKSWLDRPEVRRVLFHPRRDYGLPPRNPDARLVEVEAAPGISIGGRLYPAGPAAPLVLYFHGNGEIAADYDGLAPLYIRLGLALLVWDYRGYGRSGGTPAAAHLLGDAWTCFQAAPNLLQRHGLEPERLYLMGRSLGSAAALEIAPRAGPQLAGLIIESGFADTPALLARLGVPLPPDADLGDGFDNRAKIARVTVPTLVIHGRRDVLIPPQDGESLYQACAAPDKRLVLIPGGGHNDLMVVGRELYFGSIREFVGI